MLFAVRCSLLLFLLQACVHMPDVPPAALAPTTAIDAQVCWVELARGEGSAAFATRGPTKTKRLDGTVSGLLVRHPQGDVLVDMGNSPDFLEQLAGYGWWAKLLIRQLPGRMSQVSTHAEALARVGADPAGLKWIVGTHAHLDHVGGASQLPGVTVLLSDVEIPFVEALENEHAIDLLPSQAAALRGRMQPVVFDGPPTGPFPASHDLFGDGAIVLVPMPGHTPGSLGVIVTAARIPKLFHIGDVTMIAEGYERPAPKGFIVRTLDADYRATAEQIGNVHAVHKAELELRILPAHDRTAWSAVFGDTPRCLPE